MTDFGFNIDANPPHQTPESVITLLPEQKTTLDILLHMVNFGDTLLLVTGAHGSGKTTLALELVRQSGQAENCLYILADLMFGVPSLLRRIGDMSQLSLPTQTADAIEILKHNAALRVDDARKLIVIIDNADQIDVDTLNEIAQLSELFGRGIRFVLLGVTGFEKHIRLDAERTGTLSLLPLGASSAQALLQRKFSPNAPLPLAQEDLAHIYDKAQGLPGALILLAGDYVMTVDETRTPSSKKTPAKPAAKAQKFPLTHVLALAFVALALLFSYLYNPSKSEDTAANNELTSEPIDVLNSIPLPENNAQTQAESIPVPAPDYNYSQTEPASSLNTEPAPSLEFNEEPAAPVAIAPTPEVRTPAPVVAEPKVEPKTEPKAASAQNTASSDKQKLKAVPSGFVVQVFASYELASAQSFIKQYSSIKPALYWYETRHNNKPWYVVVAGVYKDRHSAQQAVERWPAALRKQSPWIRDIKAVQEALR